MEVESKAIKLIKSKYWNNGWLPDSKRELSSSERDYLSSLNLYFEPVTISHDQLIKEIKDLSSGINLKDCYNLLSASISTRNMADRSFLSSVLQAIRMPNHKHDRNEPFDSCKVCMKRQEVNIDLQVMLFEKLMWGGVRLTSPEYIWLDLTLFKLHKHKPYESSDLETLLAEHDADEPLSASKYAASLKKLKGNKGEREILCGVLGVCDILQNPNHKGFLENYVRQVDRDEPNQHFIDLNWPYCWYNRSFGVNTKAIRELSS